MVIASLDGPSVYRYLLSEIETARSESAELQERLDQLDRELDELTTDRAETVASLARHYLPQLTQATVDGTFHGIRDELYQVLLSKQQHRRDLSKQIRERHAHRLQLEAQLEAVTGKLNQKVAERDAAEVRVADALLAHPQFTSLSREALQAEQRLARDEDRVEEIRLEATQKLPAYDSSRLFRYLYDRDFGTPRYRGRGLSRRLDRWVARLIGFAGARRSYEFLRATPELISREVSARREQFESQMQRVEQIEAAVSREQGLTEILAEGEALGGRRDAIVANLGQDQEQTERLEKQMLALDESRGEHYHRAIERLGDWLETTETSVLAMRAGATPEAEDDQLVAALAQVAQTLRSVEQRLDGVTQERERVEWMRHDLEYVVTRFRQMDFDSERSYFLPEFDPAEAVRGLRSREMRKHALWRRFSGHQRFRPTWLESTATTASSVLNSEVGGVLFHVLLNVAGSALKNSVGRGMRRRGGGGGGGPRPRGRSRGGFTSGRGF